MSSKMKDYLARMNELERTAESYVKNYDLQFKKVQCKLLKVHLSSLPLSNPFIPSIQKLYLKSV